jgi:hypothetical protein
LSVRVEQRRHNLLPPSQASIQQSNIHHQFQPITTSNRGTHRNGQRVLGVVNAFFTTRSTFTLQFQRVLEREGEKTGEEGNEGGAKQSDATWLVKDVHHGEFERVGEAVIEGRSEARLPSKLGSTRFPDKS